MFKRSWLYQLWKDYPLLGVIFFLFVALQGFIDYKVGLVATPFYQYGMYAAPAPPADTIITSRLWVNQSLVNGYTLSRETWDKILLAPQRYKASQHPSPSPEQIGIWLSYIHYPCKVDTAVYANTIISEQAFNQWYKAKALPQWLHQPVNSFKWQAVKCWRSGGNWIIQSLH